jgi:putative endopeptidase
MTLPSGISIDELDPGIRPQDDLFRHVNGRWLARTEIPADRARDSAFRVLAAEAENAVREIVAEAASAPEGSGERKFGDLYASFMDADRAELLGSQPISQTLAAARAVSSIPELLETLGRLEPRGIGDLYRLFVSTDPGNPERYLVFFEQGAISLPNESYYREERFAGVRDAFAGHVQRMFELAGLPGADGAARRVLALETAVAGHHWDNVASRDREKTYNLFTWAGVLSAGPDLRTWLAAMDPPAGTFDEIVLRQPSFSAGLASLLTDEHVPAWRDWLCWQVIHSAAGYLSEAFVQEDFDFYGRILSGTPQLRERWKRGVSLVEWAMGEAVGRVYVGRHFPPGTRERVDVLVANLLEAYRQAIEKLDWMEAGTRRRALDKLAKFTPKIGYPESWRDYSSLRIDPADLMANVRAAHAFEFRRQLNKIGKPVDRDEWHMTPQTVNAYYNSGMNEIVFPAAILQDPFFNPDRDDAANYGAIGAIIGHEIGHGFDDQGSKYDGDGRLTDWWSATDRQAFETRTRSLIGQYNGLAPRQAPDQHVNGALTIGENIGDLGGLGIAWQAYQMSLRGEEAPVIDGLTGGQRFFMSWARTWQQKIRDTEAIRLLAIDPHSPGEFRCNQIVRNLDEFYAAFDVGAADKLWLEPATRVRIWSRLAPCGRVPGRQEQADQLSRSSSVLRPLVVAPSPGEPGEPHSQPGVVVDLSPPRRVVRRQRQLRAKDLQHQPRLEPHIRLLPGVHPGRPLRRDQRRQPRRQRSQVRIGKPGSALRHRPEHIGRRVIGGKQHRPVNARAPPPPRERPDHNQVHGVGELSPVVPLELDPPPPPGASLIDGIRPCRLAHQPLAPIGDRLLERRL